MTVDQIVEETRGWPDEAVAELLDKIRLARHGVEDAPLDPEARNAIRRRVDDIRSGKEKGIPGDIVTARIRKIVGR